MKAESPSHGCVQLELELLDAGHARSAPWGGVSPRVLTRAHKRFTLKAQAAKSTSDFVDPEQYDLWLPAKKGPFVYEGAPLLVALEEV